MHNTRRMFLPFLPAILLGGLPAAIAQMGPPPKLTPEQTQQLSAAKTADELVMLARESLARKDVTLASAAVERACAAQPDLLTDSKRQSPKSWNDFWFGKRAELRAKKLPRADAGTRVELAVWLNEAGAVDDARQMLKAALDADQDHAEAKALAEKWGLTGEGPVRFDLRYGASQPMLLPSFQDEGVELATRKDRAFLVLPFAYRVTDAKLMINKSMLKTQLDDGKPAMIRGLAVLDNQSSGSSTGGPRQLDLKLQDGNQPLYERMDVARKADRSGLEVTCHNTTRPPAPRVPGERGAPSAPRERPLPPEARDASGYAAFIIEVPQGFKSIKCEYRGVEPLEIETVFLAALAGLPPEATPAERQKLLDVLIPYAGSKHGPVAAAATHKLALLRYGEAPSGSALQTPALHQKLDGALVTGLAHPEERARSIAFESVVYAPAPVSDDMLKAIRSSKDAGLLEGIVNAAARLLVPVDEENPAAGQAAPAEPGLQRVLEALPASPVPMNCFALLGACLGSSHAAIQQRVIDLLLADGTKQSVATLAATTGSARDLLIGRFKSIDKPELKGVLLRALLVRSDPASLERLLASAADVEIVITQEDDPLIAALSAPQSPASLAPLLELLSRADLSAMSSSSSLKRAMENLAAMQQSDPGVRKGLLKLAAGRFQAPYEAPIRRNQSPQSQDSAFETVLASLATTPDLAIAQPAATALIRSGRIRLLDERLSRNDAKLTQALVQALFKDKTLWELESFSAFLANRLREGDAKTMQIALGALVNIQKTIDSKQRWRVNLAIKQNLERNQLVELASHSDEKVAQAGGLLLGNLLGRKPSEAAEIAALPDRSSREAKMAAIEEEYQTRPAGPFACMVYLDLQRSQSVQDSTEVDRRGVPLPVPTLLMQRPTKDRVAILLKSMDITASSRDGLSPGAIAINASLLLRAALESPPAEKEGLSAKIDMLQLAEPRVGELKYEQLGQWSCELQIQSVGGVDSPKPLQISGAKIVLEPIAP